jgi:peptide/nickel transport system permease protein
MDRRSPRRVLESLSPPEAVGSVWPGGGVGSLSPRGRLVVGRLVWGVAVVWFVLTVTWVIMNLLPAERAVGFSSVEMGVAAAYENPPGPLEMYLDWMWSFLTLQWGQSLVYERPVVEVYAQRVPVTMAYVVPGVVVAVLAGTGLTTVAAVRPQGYANRAMSLLSYGGLSVPAFIFAQAIWLGMVGSLGWIHVVDPDLPLTSPQTLKRLSIPAAIVALNFFAVQVRHAQGETAEYLDAEFVKTVRSKGAGRLRVAVHVFRNTWPSLSSMVLGESLGLLLLIAIVIEDILLIDGIAVAMFQGFALGDPMLTFTAVFCIVLVGVAGTLARDVGRLLLDPRIEE